MYKSFIHNKQVRIVKMLLTLLANTNYDLLKVSISSCCEVSSLYTAIGKHYTFMHVCTLAWTTVTPLRHDYVVLSQQLSLCVCLNCAGSVI